MKNREHGSWWWWAVVVVALVGAVGRIWQTRESFWVDELHTAWCVAGSLADVAERAAIGNQSPLFFWVEWLMVRWLRPSEFSLRLLSVAAGSLLPLALFEVGRRWTGSAWVGFVAAALVVVDPLAIFFATEARPYALVQLLAVLHVWAFAEMLRQPTRWLRMTFVGGAVALFYLHYTAGLLLAAEVVVWGMLTVFQRDRATYRWTWLVMDGGMIAVLCLPASAQLVAIFQQRENWAGFIHQRPLWELFAVLPWSAAAVLVFAGFAFRKVSARVGTSEHMLALCWLLIPLAIAWVLTAADAARILFPRYLAASAPAAIMLAAMCVNFAPWRWARFSLGAMLIMVAMWTSGIAEQWREDGRMIGDRSEDWRGAVAWLNERLTADKYPVFVASGLIEADGLTRDHDRLLEEYCLLPVTSLYRLQIGRENLEPLAYRQPSNLRPEALALLESRGGAWVIARGRHAAEFKSRETGKNKSEPTATDWHVGESRMFGSIYVARLFVVPAKE